MSRYGRNFSCFALLLHPSWMKMFPWYMKTIEKDRSLIKYDVLVDIKKVQIYNIHITPPVFFWTLSNSTLKSSFSTSHTDFMDLSLHDSTNFNWSRLKSSLNKWNLDQLGPQQLKYMTFLRDSSDCLAFCSLTLLETAADDGEDSLLLAWGKDLRLALACWCIDLMV